MNYGKLLNGCGLFLIVMVRPVAADVIQSHESIKTTAEIFITNAVTSSHGKSPTVNAGNLDTRLRLKQCDIPLEAFQPSGGRTLGNATVGVRCPGAQPWTLYVPVKVSIFEYVVVAARSLSKGMLVQDSDVQLIEKDLAALRSGYYQDPSEVIGKQVTRTITMGAAVTTRMIKPEKQIKRGQLISLIAVSHGLKVQMTGEAMADGAAGDLIRVRNLSTKKIVEGVVQSASTVQIVL